MANLSTIIASRGSYCINTLMIASIPVTSVQSAADRLVCCIAYVTEWLSANQLHFNPAKTSHLAGLKVAK